MITTVTSSADFYDALNHSGLVVVDFFATWCGPCKIIAPILNKFSEEYPQVKFIKVDVDELQNITENYKVCSMPTIIFLKDGQVVYTVVGAQEKLIKDGLTTHA